MASNCCQLVGALNLGINGCFISISTSSSTEIITNCDNIYEGPTVATLNLSAYASTDLWTGCPGRAGVSIPYNRRYDCDGDVVHFIFSGRGQSFYVGDVGAYVSLYRTASTTSESMSASSSSGPAAVYMRTTQYNGYGMTYRGDPISFTTSEEGTTISLGGVFSGETYYLQNFSFDAQPGQFPIVSYSFVYSPGA